MNRLILFHLIIILGAITVFGQDICNQSAPTPLRLRITGEIDPTNHTKTLMILRQNDNPHNPTAEVPVINGKVDFVFETSEPDRFSLSSREDLYTLGTWIPLEFFAEDGEISLSGKTTEDWPECLQLKIMDSNSPLNRRLMECMAYDERVFSPGLDSIANLIVALDDNAYSDSGKELFADLNQVFVQIEQYPDSMPLLEKRNQLYQKLDAMRRDKTMYTDEYLRLYNQSKAISNQRIEHHLDTYATADGDLFSLSVLFDDFMRSEDNDSIRERIIDTYHNNFKDRFCNTAMGKRMDEAVVGYEVSHVGGRYPDYQLPDADGNMHNIKDLINGGLVLIDLWGSTCTPCRVNSRMMIPIYNKFKDKGFDIIGIAREYGSLDRFHHVVAKDGYPWRQLIELDDATGVFNLHGIPNAMGGTYLVGPSQNTSSDNAQKNDIRIILINPTPEQLEKYLREYYQIQG